MAANRAKEIQRALVFEAQRVEERPVLNARDNRVENLKKAWYKFSRNKLSVAGLVIVAAVILAAILAPYITPYPKHAGAFTDFANVCKAPGKKYFLGTDNMGRDILTRYICLFWFLPFRCP